MAQNPLNQYESEQLPVGWPVRFFSVSLVIFIAALLSYLGLAFGYQPYLRAQIEKQDESINQLVGAISREDQEKFADAYSKIINLKSLLDNHARVSKLFSILERTSNKKVFFSNLYLRVPERELELDGIADSYNSLSEQLQSFSEAPEFSRYLLNQSQFSNNAVQFKATLKLNEGVLK